MRNLHQSHGERPLLPLKYSTPGMGQRPGAAASLPPTAGPMGLIMPIYTIVVITFVIYMIIRILKRMNEVEDEDDGPEKREEMPVHKPPSGCTCNLVHRTVREQNQFTANLLAKHKETSILLTKQLIERQRIKRMLISRKLSKLKRHNKSFSCINLSETGTC
jgi:hypothetical protein